LNRAASKIFARAEKGESGNPRRAAETEACAGRVAPDGDGSARTAYENAVEVRAEHKCE